MGNLYSCLNRTIMQKPMQIDDATGLAQTGKKSMVGGNMWGRHIVNDISQNTFALWHCGA